MKFLLALIFPVVLAANSSTLPESKWLLERVEKFEKERLDPFTLVILEGYQNEKDNLRSMTEFHDLLTFLGHAQQNSLLLPPPSAYKAEEEERDRQKKLQEVIARCFAKLRVKYVDAGLYKHFYGWGKKEGKR